MLDFNIWNEHKFTGPPVAPGPPKPDAVGGEVEPWGVAAEALASLLKRRGQETRPEPRGNTPRLHEAVDRLLAMYWG